MVESSQNKILTMLLSVLKNHQVRLEDYIFFKWDLLIQG